MRNSEGKHIRHQENVKIRKKTMKLLEQEN